MTVDNCEELSLVIIPMNVARRLGMAAVAAGGWIGAGEVDFHAFNGEETIAYLPLDLLRKTESRRVLSAVEAEKIAAEYGSFAEQRWSQWLARGGEKRAAQIRQAINAKLEAKS